MIGLAGQRLARDAARAAFRRHLAQAKVDFSAPVLKRRVIAEVQQASLSAATQAMEIANDNRGVVAATAGALLLWLTRRPVLAGARKLADIIWKPKTKSIWPASIESRFAGYWRQLKEYADE